MISPDKESEIRRLIATGMYSYRQISNITGCGRGTIGDIAHNKFRRKRESTNFDTGSDESKPKKRCKFCGGLVYMPCRLCKMRDYLAIVGRVKPAKEVE